MVTEEEEVKSWVMANKANKQVVRAHVDAVEYSWCGTQVELLTVLHLPTALHKQEDLNDQTTEVAATKAILTPDKGSGIKQTSAKYI